MTTRDLALVGPGVRRAEIPIVASCVVLGAIGYTALFGMPVVIDALTSLRGYSNGQAGYTASGEYLGMMAGAAVGSLLITRMSRRSLASAGLTVTIASDLLSMGSTAFTLLLTARFLAGFGAGFVNAVSVAVLAGYDHKARNFMYFIFGSVLASAGILFVFPAITARHGISGIYAGYALICIAGYLCMPWLPRGASPAIIPAELAGQSNARFRQVEPWLCLGAVFMFYLMVSTFYGYAETIGVAIGLDRSLVGTLLASGTVLSLGACLLALWLSERVGQSKPLLSVLALLVISQIGAALHFGGVTYITDVALVLGCWNFVDIYQLGTISLIDPSGVSAARVSGAQTLAMTIGPTAGGYLLDRGLNYRELLLLLAACAGVAFVLYLCVYTSLRRRAPHLADAA
jgi:predicted MFS family arabinose efflux permease